MTPQKKKAEELINRFITEGCLFANAKQCALICVDEIIKELKEIETSKDVNPNMPIGYWQQVKTEIEKL